MKICLHLLLFLLAAGAPRAQAGSIWDRCHYGLNPFLSVTMEAPYGPDPEEVADVVKPAFGANGAAVLLIHGGGWSAGSRFDFASEATRLARAGFTVINIDYRLGRAGQPSTFWPAQLEDAQLAVRWAKRYARELGIDPKRICAYGGSAGGQLAMFTGYLHASRPGDRSTLFAEILPDVACVVNLSGPADLVHPAIEAKLLPLPFLGTSDPEKGRAVLRDASPLFLIDSASAPTLVVHGRADDVVPLVLAEELFAVLKKQQVPAVLHEQDGGHGFDGVPEDQITETKKLIADFLRQHLVR